MIRALIFDCFGVLTTDGWLPLKAELFGNTGTDYETATELNKQCDAGVISYPTFVSKISALAGRDEGEIQERLQLNVANHPLFEQIKRHFYGHYKLGILSNAGDDWLDLLFTPEQLSLFDAIALSYETQVIKPEPQAYAIIAQRLGVAVDECILIDDQTAFCDGARAAGMTALPYTNLAATMLNLRRQLNLA